jgi:hypothetical protein
MSDLYENNLALTEHYQRLWEDALSVFESGKCTADDYLAGKKQDDRRGVTLLARWPSSAIERLSPLLLDLSRRFPEHYVVPTSDLHVTILSIEPVRSGFVASPDLISSIIEAVEEIIDGEEIFRVELSGISASPPAAFVCGYPRGERLNLFRDTVKRECFKRDVGLLVDSRYTLRSAHSSVLRFILPTISPLQVAWLKKVRTLPLGTHDLSTVELVEGDWYMRRESITLYKKWELRRN